MKLQTTKRPDAKPPPEKLVQARLIQCLLAAGFLVVRHNSGAHKGAVNNYFRAYQIFNMPQKWQSAGFPDVAAMRDGRILLFEIKADGGKLSEAQQEFQRVAAEHGMTVFTVYGMAGIEPLMREIDAAREIENNSR